MRRLSDVLISGGATGLAGWTLMDATGISADGSTIAGTGINPSGKMEAFVVTTSGQMEAAFATIPEPSTTVLTTLGAAGLAAAFARRRRTGQS
jgi:hypothetical protein